MSQVAASSNQYWRSLDELADTPEFRQYVEAEFPSRAQELVDPLSRRRFLQVMGASLALAGTGCDFIRWPKENILPFAARPQHRDPGTTVSYATSFDLGGVGTGLLVTSYDGRPIKVEGNPQHPESLGATSAIMQASVLDLYDPERSQAVQKVGAEGASEVSTWEAAEAELEPRLRELKAARGKGLAVIARASSSRSFQRLLERLRRDMPEARVAVWEPVSRDAARAGAALAFGRPLRQQPSIARADVIVSFDDDLLNQHPAALRLAREWGRRRKPEQGRALPRLYIVEGVFSITGSNADHRLAVRTAEVGTVLTKVAAELVGQGLEAPAAVRTWLEGRRPTEGDPHRGFVLRLARDLLSHRGTSLLTVGPRQAASVHAAAALLNQLLGNVGQTVTYTEDPDGDRPSHVEALAAAVAAMNAGEVQLALVLGANPVYDAPADLAFAQAYGKVAQRVHLGSHLDETGRASTWHLPMAHYLEAWGDARAWDGTLSPVQPLIAPLFAGRTPAELLALALGESKRNRRGYELARRTFSEVTGAREVELERAWRRFLHDGVHAGSALPAVEAQVQVDAVIGAQPDQAPSALAAGDYELVFVPDNRVWDGRWANNAWLQEFPEPLTKLTWDNALLVNPVLARDLGLKPDELVAVTVKGSPQLGPLEVPVFVLPGQPRRSVTLTLGWGRGPAAGVVANGTGFDAYRLRGQAGLDAALCTLQPTGRTYGLATTQDHHAIRTPLGDTETHDRVFGERLEFARGADGAIVAKQAGHTNYEANPLFREATVEEYAKHPRFAQKVVGPDPIKTQVWDPPIDYGKGHQWGMTIDLSACTGCGACVVACVAENNIPMVGKSEVARGREMHWLRIDRYFKGDPLEGERREGDPRPDDGGAPPAAPIQVAHQPIPCMQCENAPCEAVCPVGATTHSEDGLNDMAYNRCVGTRYCANNCPYKVRKFNYFWNHNGPFHPRSNPITIGGRVAAKLPKPAITVPEQSLLERMRHNPDVSLRSRGVMEKCTYCVQRIRHVSIKAKNEKRRVRDGEVVTACQQACPTEAIIFGDLNDPASMVSQQMRRERTYGMLAELNTRPRTQFLAKLRNPGQEA
ncbi:MAG: TAT-variant-translocated molybdopterin oxidoreductase [Planctomycetota bacterium]|nr:TAT-variant-translocated molybdopterin oxidoreductase [Planctomycetota bacterium]